MSTNTYVALKTTTVTGSPASDITFTSIPTTYTDLMLVVTGSAASGNIGTSYIQLNGDTGTTYSTTYMAGNGSTATSSRFSSSHGIAIGGITAGIQTNQQTTTAHIMNYSNNTTNKTVLARYSNAGYETNTSVGLWQPATISTSAVTSIRIYIGYSNTTTSQDNWAVGTTATIYGVASADVGAYATGGIITQDANYYYHAFGSSSTFTPTRNLTADILVVAGGGGAAGITGNSSANGAGGAGGLLAFSSQSLTSNTNYSCTVGAGGAGRAGGGASGSQGGNSQFASLTASVGGGYGAYNAYTGGTGGSGGGGGGFTSTGGSPTSGQGYAGGGGNSSYDGGPAGGGAGAAAANVTSNNGVNGGNGVSTYSSWLSAAGLGVLNPSDGLFYIAGGGGGGSYAAYAVGTGGLGGGGNGVNANNGTGYSGTPNTGGGGGAIGAINSSNSSGTGGNGGSGLIIVRYAK